MDNLRHKILSHFIPPRAIATFYTPEGRSHQLHSRLHEMGCTILRTTISKTVFINSNPTEQVTVSRRCQGEECSAHILGVQGGKDISPCRRCKMSADELNQFTLCGHSK